MVKKQCLITVERIMLLTIVVSITRSKRGLKLDRLEAYASIHAVGRKSAAGWERDEVAPVLEVRNPSTASQPKPHLTVRPAN
jgi:hypothetical protein